MSIRVFCPQCNKTHRVGDENAGKHCKCRRGHVLFIPKQNLDPEIFDLDLRRPPLRRPSVQPAAWKWLLIGGASVLSVILQALGVSPRPARGKSRSQMSDIS